LLRNWLFNLKNYYVDAVDPEGTVLKRSLRTALACTVCIVLLQLLGNLALSGWAGFAAFAFVQNDTQDLFYKRLCFLLVIILVFSGLTFFGLYLGNNLFLFLISIPLIVFLCTYPACLGFSFFNAGAWALFIYILAGAKPGGWLQTYQIVGTFLLCGVISLIISLYVFPIHHYRKIMSGYERILMKILLIVRYTSQGKHKYFIKYNTQLDNMLELQEKNINSFSEAASLPSSQQVTLINLAQSLWQIGLMTKSALTILTRVSKYTNYHNTELSKCTLLFESLLLAMRIQLRQGKQPDFDSAKKQLNSYRDSLTRLRKEELDKTTADFSEYLEYASYFYHFLQLLKLLETFSQNITELKGREDQK
jgi:hypothetical protein